MDQAWQSVTGQFFLMHDRSQGAEVNWLVTMGDHSIRLCLVRASQKPGAIVSPMIDYPAEVKCPVLIF